MFPINLTKLTAGQIAALTGAATLAAALVAGFFAFIVALVNAWSAARVAKAERRHAFLLTVLGPYLKTIDHELWLLRLWLNKIGLFPYKSIQTTSEMLEEIASRAQVSKKTAINGLLWKDTRRNRRLKAAIDAMQKRDAALDTSVTKLKEFLENLHFACAQRGEVFDTAGTWHDHEGAKPLGYAFVDAIKATVEEGYRLRSEVEHYLLS